MRGDFDSGAPASAWEEYEREKQAVAALGLTDREYQAEIRALAERLGL